MLVQRNFKEYGVIKTLQLIPNSCWYKLWFFFVRFFFILSQITLNFIQMANSSIMLYRSWLFATYIQFVYCLKHFCFSSMICLRFPVFVLSFSVLVCGLVSLAIWFPFSFFSGLLWFLQLIGNSSEVDVIDLCLSCYGGSGSTCFSTEKLKIRV